MPETEDILVQLDYPLNHVKEPIIYHLVTDYNLIPNVLRAKIDAHVGGTLLLHLAGTRADLDSGLAFLRGLGIAITKRNE